MGEIKNLILIVLDSFRQDHISYYNKGERVFENIPACKTPNLDSFAKDSLVFHNVYPSGLPTIPVRYEILTGMFSLPYRPWQPLHPYPKDITAADILSRRGFICGLISDTYHLFRPDMNFHRSFHCFRWIRGQEYDAYVSSPPKRRVEDYVNENYPENWRGLVAKFLANTDDFKSEEDYFPAKVFNEAIKWLKDNRVHKRIFLWVDCFDPHEPWDPPPRFDTYTDPSYEGPRLILPMGGHAEKWATREQIDYIRGLYAGEASFVDYCFGLLLEALKDLGYYDDSIIIVVADHGHPLADHGKFLKGPDRMYSELLKVPFIMHVPGYKHRDFYALIQFPDILPTALEMLGLVSEARCMQGWSFLEVIDGVREEHRTHIIAGYHEAADRCIRNKEWSYIKRPEGQPDELYNLTVDPRERNNLIDSRADVAASLSSYYGLYFHRIGVPWVVKGLQGKYETSR
ncbi:MAG: sulfatase [Candidatus Bathyarchaeia archaeon]